VIEAKEQSFIEKLISHPAVETLAEAVLHGLAMVLPLVTALRLWNIPVREPFSLRRKQSRGDHLMGTEGTRPESGTDTDVPDLNPPPPPIEPPSPEPKPVKEPGQPKPKRV